MGILPKELFVGHSIKKYIIPLVITFLVPKELKVAF